MPDAKDMRARPALQRAQILLQRIPRRIRQPRILMPLVLADRLLLIRGRQIDRHIHRTGQLIRRLPIVNRPRRKPLLLRVHHPSLLATLFGFTAAGCLGLCFAETDLITSLYFVSSNGTLAILHRSRHHRLHICPIQRLLIFQTNMPHHGPFSLQ